MRNRRLTQSVVGAIALVALLLPAAAPAQDEPASQFGEQINVTEVLLDVLVTDDKGNVILGLEPSDFIVEEKGAPVSLNSATFYSNRRFVDSADLAERLGVERGQVPVDRFFILFFEETRHFNPAFTAYQLEAIRMVKKWVYSELLPNDWVAVVGWDARLSVYQDFTTDNEKIVRALNQLAKGKRPGDLWESRVATHEGPSLAKNLPRGDELRRASKRMFAALETVGEAAGYITGRKNLLLFTIGLGETDVGGDITQAGVVGDTPTTYTPDSRYYAPMMEQLNDNNVAVYSISVLRDDSDLNPDIAELQNGLSVLSNDTGGRYFFNFINFRDPLHQIAEDNNGYYLLSYRSEYTLDEKDEEDYRQVSVKTVNPTFRVRARQGYKLGG